MACNSDLETKPHFKSIQFSYFDISPLAFTLRVSNQDSVFLRQSFAQDSRKGLKNDTTYHFALTGRLKQQLDSLIAVIDFGKLDTLYETGHLDGDGYQLYVENDSLKKHFRVHSTNPPKELEAIKELFLKMRSIFLLVNNTTSLPESSPNTQVYGKPKIFVLKNSDSSKYYLADSIAKIFQKGYIGQSPLISINGVVFRYQTKLDTIALPLLKNEITSIDILNMKDSRFIYGRRADSGAVIINTIVN
jgi:hypothetical protein